MDKNERNAAWDAWNARPATGSSPVNEGAPMNKDNPVNEDSGPVQPTSPVTFTHVFVWRVGLEGVETEKVAEYMSAVGQQLTDPRLTNSGVIQYFLPRQGTNEIKLTIVNLKTGTSSVG